MKSIIDYIPTEINESMQHGYVVTYKLKGNDSLWAFRIETDDNIQEFAKKIYKNDLAEDYFCSLLNAGMSSGSPRNCYTDKFLKYIEKEGVEKDAVFSICTLKDYQRMTGKTAKVFGRKFE